MELDVKMSPYSLLSSNDYKPSAKEEYMNDKQLKYFAKKLISWKNQLIKLSTNTLGILQESHDSKNDPNDLMVTDVNIDIELRTKTRYKKLINKIDEALDRIERKEYGYCIKTGEEIGLDRLEARPIAFLCIEAQQELEKRKKSYSIDEDLI